MVTVKLECGIRLLDSESAIGFAAGSMVTPFWSFPGRNFAANFLTN